MKLYHICRNWKSAPDLPPPIAISFVNFLWLAQKQLQISVFDSRRYPPTVGENDDWSSWTVTCLNIHTLGIRGPPLGLTSTFFDIPNIFWRSKNVEDMSKNVEKFSENFAIMSKMLNDVEVLVKNLKKCRSHVEKCWKMSKNVEKCRGLGVRDLDSDLFFRKVF